MLVLFWLFAHNCLPYKESVGLLRLGFIPGNAGLPIPGEGNKNDEAFSCSCSLWERAVQSKVKMMRRKIATSGFKGGVVSVKAPSTCKFD